MLGIEKSFATVASNTYKPRERLSYLLVWRGAKSRVKLSVVWMEVLALAIDTYRALASVRLRFLRALNIHGCNIETGDADDSKYQDEHNSWDRSNEESNEHDHSRCDLECADGKGCQRLVDHVGVFGEAIRYLASWAFENLSTPCQLIKSLMVAGDISFVDLQRTSQR